MLPRCIGVIGRVLVRLIGWSIQAGTRSHGFPSIRILQEPGCRLPSGFDGFSKMSADACPDRLHYPTAIAYRPMERHRSARARPVAATPRGVAETGRPSAPPIARWRTLATAPSFESGWDARARLMKTRRSCKERTVTPSPTLICLRRGVQRRRRGVRDLGVDLLAQAGNTYRAHDF